MMGKLGVEQALGEVLPSTELQRNTLQSPIVTVQQISHDHHNLETQIDMYLDYLLKTPFDQRQYIFPALFDIPNMPKKIRTHPDIAIWKGKLPTKIDPVKQAFADKYLKDMNPAFYIYLAPKGVATDVENVPLKTEGVPINTGHHIPQIIGKSLDFPSVRDVLTQPTELQENPDLAKLTVDDIPKINAGLGIFSKYLNQISQNEEYRFLLAYHTDYVQEKINPFQVKVARINLMEGGKSLDSDLKKIGFKTAMDFAIKADELAKAYRVARMPYAVALQTRRYKTIEPQNKTEKIINAAAKMYEAYPKDAILVGEHLNEVRQIFINNGFQNALDAETFDALRE